MKFSIQRLLLIALVLIEVSMPAIAATPEPVKTEAVAAAKVKVTISFTVARRRDCEGFGICDLEAILSNRTANKGTGLIYTDDTNRNMVVLEINKSTGITRECNDKFFRNGSFLMEDEFEIPSWLLKELAISGTKTIQKGQHRIQETNGILYVYLPIR